MFSLWQKISLGVLLFVFLLMFVGYMYEVVGARRDARLHPAPGRLISVDGHRLHLLCKGDVGPTVVVEQGAGELSRFWWPVQEDVATFARVCTYDRAGFGWSDAEPGGRSIEDRAQELRGLLTDAEVPGPYIFVAHSYGGLIVRSYFTMFPGDVAGFVLVDTPEEASIFERDVLDFYAKARRMNRVAAFAARFGVLRLLRRAVELDRYGLWLSKPGEYSALCDDLASLELVPSVQRRSKAQGSLGGLPIIVITHGQAFPGPFAILERNWVTGQEALAALSTNSILMVAKKSNHMIQHDEPELVVNAIRRMHEAVKSGSRLTEV